MSPVYASRLKHRLVRVTWVDSCRQIDWGSTMRLTKDATTKLEELECESVGYLLVENENAIVVVPHTGVMGELSVGTMTIPRSAVLEIEDLYVASIGVN